MGKVRIDRVKKASRKLIQRFPDRFTTEFEENKIALKDITKINSKKMRNLIAGYITSLIVSTQKERDE